MFKNWIIAMAISFVIRQLEKWREMLDWEMVKKDAEERVRALIPGDWFDDEAVSMVMTLINVVQKVLSESEQIQDIFEYLADGKFQEAWESLRDLILDQWSPETDQELKVYQCIENCDKIA